MIAKLLLSQFVSMALLVAVSLAHRYSLLSFELFAVFFGVLLVVIVLCALIHVGGALYCTYKSTYSINVTSLVGLFLSFIPILFLTTLVLQMKRVPVINDITTDMVNPPLFRHAQINRNQQFNSLKYRSMKAELQRIAYPDIQPLLTSLSKEQTFLFALEAAKESGWRIQREDSDQGFIEATHKSLLLGFTDDIIIRVRDEGELRRIDARSVSQVGKSDLGANARRIRMYSRLLNDKM